MRTPNVIHIKRIVSSKIGGAMIGIAFILLSFIFIGNQTILTFPLVIIFFINAIYHLIQGLDVSNVGSRYRYLMETMLYLALSWLFLQRNQIVFAGLGIFLVMWSIVNTFIKALNLYIDYQTNRRFSLYLIIVFLAHVFISFYLIIYNINFSGLFVISLSGYLLFYGIDLTITSLLNLKQRLRLPSFLAILLPDFFLRQLNRLNIRVEKQEESKKISQDYVNIYVHLGNKISSRFGHVDIGYKGLVYTYGNHDPNNRNKYFLWGSGILGVIDEERFISFSVNEDNKRIFKFVYQLTNQQKENLEHRINELLFQTKEFKWVKETDDLTHYLPMVNKSVGNNYGKYYEFLDSSKFRYYNVLKINCVLVSYYLINDKQNGLFKLEGIISPGAYFETLMSLYNQNNSPIIEMSVLK